MSLICRTVYSASPKMEKVGKGPKQWNLGKKGDAAVVSKKSNVHGVNKRYHVVRIWNGSGDVTPSGYDYKIQTSEQPDDFLAWAMVPRSHLQVLGAEETSGTIRVGDVVAVEKLEGEYYVVLAVLHTP